MGIIQITALLIGHRRWNSRFGFGQSGHLFAVQHEARRLLRYRGAVVSRRVLGISPLLPPLDVND